MLTKPRLWIHWYPHSYLLRLSSVRRLCNMQGGPKWAACRHDWHDMTWLCATPVWPVGTSWNRRSMTDFTVSAWGSNRRLMAICYAQITYVACTYRQKRYTTQKCWNNIVSAGGRKWNIRLMLYFDAQITYISPKKGTQRETDETTPFQPGGRKWNRRLMLYLNPQITYISPKKIYHAKMLKQHRFSWGQKLK